MTAYSTVHFYLLLLGLATSSCETQEKHSSINTSKKFCGPALTELLNNICKLYYEPSDQVAEEEVALSNNQRDIVEECCQSPCSLLYITLAYCKEPKVNDIKKNYGEVEYNHFDNLRQNISDNTLAKVYKDKSMPDQVKPAPKTKIRPDGSISRKKHLRKHRQKRCQCKQNAKILETEKILLERIVPQYAIGEVELQDNEPIILTNIID